MIRWRVVCGLGRDDDELLPDQAVEQGRLADVRPADDADGAAADARSCLPSLSSSACAACCSARWRERAAARRARGRARQRRIRPRRICSCASPCAATTRYRGSAALAPAGSPAGAVLASFAGAAGSSAVEQRRRSAAQHRVARRLEAAVEEHRAEQRLERVGEDRRARQPPRCELALAQAQELAAGRALRRPRPAPPRAPGWRAGARARLRAAAESARRARRRRRS